MASVEGIVVFLILVAGIPLIVIETKKFPKMKVILMGYLIVIVASLASSMIFAGQTDMLSLTRSVCIMVAGLFFGAGALLSFKRMKKVIE